MWHVCYLLFVSCLHLAVAEPPQNPCDPSPCGPNSQCRLVNQHAVCSCSLGFIGNPPSCRPECVVSSECPQNRACINQKCLDPCPGTCGLNARCQVVNHNPICSCAAGFTGDPLARCLKQESKLSISYCHSCLHFLSFMSKEKLLLDIFCILLWILLNYGTGGHLQTYN